ncbi:MAG: response regulator transcription factor [Rikenellaceae bacterium]|nr:response regulator transcription factor [Rikenellaceae bacterium]
MGKLKCIIVDDEPLALELLEEYVRRTPELELLARCIDGVAALKMMEENPVDLAFLDIQMPQVNGLELAHRVGKNTKVVFTTAFEQYALEGFKADAIDYLLKPFNYDEFRHAVDKALAWFAPRRTEQPATPTATAPRSIIVKADYKQHVIPLDEILYVKGEKDYVRIRTVNGELKSLMSMRSVEQSLPSEHFQRIHRSYIVNLDRVTTVGNMHVTVGAESLPMSNSYKEDFMQRLTGRGV